MRQIIYSSEASTHLSKGGLKEILATSKRNNQRDSLTGALYLKGRTFIQVLEGPEIALKATLARIAGDTRHQNFEVSLNREIESRTFGNWSMMLIGDEPEVARIAGWYWPDGKIAPKNIGGDQLFEFLRMATQV